MNSEKVESLLERFVLAAERIANALDGNNAMQPARKEKDEPTDEMRPVSDDAPQTQANGHTVLEQFLNSRGIAVKLLPAPTPADEVIDSLSLYLGSRYNALSKLLANLKRSMQAGRPFSLTLKDYSQADVSSCCQFCTRLRDIAFLEKYRYLSSPRFVIHATPSTTPKAQKFLGGQWLERYLCQVLKSFHARLAAEGAAPIQFEYLLNPQIILPNRDDFELDILCAIGKSIFWIEAKSGDYQQHVEKYSKFSRTLALGKEYSYLVLPDLSTKKCDYLSDMYQITVCNLESFQERLLAKMNTP